ncbi:TRAP transporter large permease subunit [Chloroflexota bacterium]
MGFKKDGNDIFMNQQVKLAEMTGFRASAYRGLDSIVSGLNKINLFVRWVGMAGMLIFIGMVIFTFVDVFMRYVFNQPLAASIEITAFMMVIVVFFGVALTQLSKAHVTMDLLTAKLPKKPQLVLEAFSTFISLVIIILVAKQTILNGMTTVYMTPILRIPLNPFILIASFGIVLLILMLIRDYFNNVANSLRHGGHLWILLILIPAAVFGIFTWFALTRPHLDLSLPAWGVIGVVVMLVFFTTGMPVAFTLFGVGLVFIMFLRGTEPAMVMLGKVWYDTVSNYGWSPIMFFMLMGYICFECRFGEDLFRMGQRFLGHLKGGLAMGTTVACTAFGAVVGDTLSGTITMTAIGLPEMKKYRYNEKLAIGTLATSGTIGQLIPPSIGFILYAVLADQSVGDMFMAGVFPGLLCCGLYMLIIFIICSIKPSLGPSTPSARWIERAGSLKGAGPIFLLFILVIGGIYAGIFTPTEGGGIGAFGSIAIGLAMRRLNWKRFTSALAEAAKYVAMCFTILGGAIFFGYFVVQSQLPMAMANYVAGLLVTSLVVMIVIILIYFILGCFLPAIPMILITVPIFLPIAIVQGWNLVWFGVIIVLMMNMACITPPFGINLFVIKGVAKVPIGEVYSGVWPFVGGLIAVIILIIAFPAIATWLPNLLKTN